MPAFIHTTDQALDRWEKDGHQYAIAVDDSPTCPAGDFHSGKNAARRAGGQWDGDTTVVDAPGAVTATINYSSETFEAVAMTKDEAEFIAQVYAHWAEGNVYAIAKDDDIVSGHYTQDGGTPYRDDVEAYFR